MRWLTIVFNVSSDSDRRRLRQDRVTAERRRTGPARFVHAHHEHVEARMSGRAEPSAERHGGQSAEAGDRRTASVRESARCSRVNSIAPDGNRPGICDGSVGIRTVKTVNGQVLDDGAQSNIRL